MRRSSQPPGPSRLMSDHAMPAGETLMGTHPEDMDSSMLPEIRQLQHVAAIGQHRWAVAEPGITRLANSP
jgi:hypothetical protein